MTPLCAATVGFEQAVHGAHGTQIAALIKERGMHTGRGSVGKALATQGIQYQLALSLAQGQGADGVAGVALVAP